MLPPQPLKLRTDRGGRQGGSRKTKGRKHYKQRRSQSHEKKTDQQGKKKKKELVISKIVVSKRTKTPYATFSKWTILRNTALHGQTVMQILNCGGYFFYETFFKTMEECILFLYFVLKVLFHSFTIKRGRFWGSGHVRSYNIIWTWPTQIFCFLLATMIWTWVISFVHCQTVF